jgi:Uma2 family endonuclease
MNVARGSRPKVKLRVEDFDLLAEGGGLSGLGRTELLDGDIYEMSPQYSRHGNAKALFHEALLDWQRAHRPDLAVRSEVSVAMPPHDEPMPDLILCLPPTGPKGIPVETVFLLIEIADGSAEHDLGCKAALYARQKVPEYWVVGLREDTIHRMWAPEGETYAERHKAAFGARIEAATLPGLAVETGAL